MKDQFVTYEIAKKLKELGFNAMCFAHWQTGTMDFKFFASIDGYNVNDTGFVSAPLWQQAIDWLASNHNLHVDVYPSHQDFYRFRLISTITGVSKYVSTEQFERNKARKAAILKALELIQK